jgi:uncharacterized membrane protein
MTIVIPQDILSKTPLTGVTAMDFFFYLLVAYGITFGMQHKAPFLRGHNDWLDKMLVCTYCTGFHAGWITWIGWKLKMIFENPMNVTGITFIEMILFALGSSAFSYFFDTAIRLMESHADPIEVVEEEEEQEEAEEEE